MTLRSARSSPSLWVVFAGLVGFATAATFSGWLRWGRDTFVLVYAGITVSFLALYVLATGVRPRVQLRRRWPAGLIMGLLTGALLAYGVQKQPTSSRPVDGALAAALLWLGVVYGLLDALLLTVVPVLSIYGNGPAEVLGRWPSRLKWAVLSLVASLGVTAAYHLGFVEFRGSNLMQPLIGNGIVTVSYLLAGNPLAPVIAHVTMHVAAVLHGVGTTTQLPPHY
jgi:hypothetical protein